MTLEVLPASMKKFRNFALRLLLPTRSNEFKRTYLQGVWHIFRVMLKKHAVNHHFEINVPKIRPTLVAAKRQREIMKIIALNELGDEDAEWFDEEDMM